MAVTSCEENYGYLDLVARYLRFRARWIWSLLRFPSGLRTYLRGDNDLPDRRRGGVDVCLFARGDDTPGAVLTILKHFA